MGSGGFRNTKYFFSFIPDRVRFTNCRTWFKAFFFGYLYIYFIKTMLRNFLFILITILWIINLIFLPNFVAGFLIWHSLHKKELYFGCVGSILSSMIDTKDEVQPQMLKLKKFEVPYIILKPTMFLTRWLEKWL